MTGEPDVATAAAGADGGGDLHADAAGHFLSTMRFEMREGDDGCAYGAVFVDEYLQATGLPWPNMAALLTLADMLIGRLASHQTRPQISVTSDLAVRLFRPAADERVEVVARLLKVGRTMSVGEASIALPRTGEKIGTAIGTFLASPRPGDLALGGFSARAEAEDAPRAATLARHVGVATPEPGVAELPALRPELTNATQSLQGGLVAVLGEAATYSALSAEGYDLHVVDTLEVHYLAAGREGPFRAQAEPHRLEVGGSSFRVMLRDVGRARDIAVIDTTTRPLH